MQLKQMIGLSSPLSYWTGESYGDNNVYDEYDNHTLVSTNATLGEGGQLNNNLSSRAINLKSGKVQVLDGTFGESAVNAREFTIAFSFRLPNRDHTQPISGFKPIVSKWNPVQQYMIGFENNILVAKIQTNAGLVELDFNYPKVIYNDRWNWVVLDVHSTGIKFTVNGISTSSSNTSMVDASTDSLFQLGGDGAEQFSEDVLINDIAFLTKYNSYFADTSYVLPRGEMEMWKNMNPLYLYNPADELDPLGPLTNHGTRDEVAYLVYDPSGPAPYKYEPSSVQPKNSVRMPINSWLTIDDTDLPLEPNNGFTVAVHGRYELPTSTSSPRYDHYFFDLRNSLDNDNGRAFVAHEYYSSSSRDWYSWKAYDGSGTQTEAGPSSYSNYNYSAQESRQIGVKMVSVDSGQLHTGNAIEGSWYTSKEYNNLPFNYTKTLTYDANRFWYAKGGVAWSDLRILGVFDYTVPKEFMHMVAYARFKAVYHFLYGHNSSGWTSALHGYSTTTPDLRHERTGASYDPDYSPSGYSHPTNVNDPLQNRNNAWRGAGYLATTSSYVGGSTAEDYIDFDTNDFTIAGFFWSRKTDARYRFMRNSSGQDIEVWMNSRDGQFSLGDIEFSVDNMLATQTVSTTSQKVKDDGFHHIVCIRKGFELQIWIDGMLEAVFITTSVHNVDSSNTTMRIYGGPLYFNDWFILESRAWTPDEIEFAYGGFGDVLKGKCTLDGAPLPSTLLTMDMETGSIIDNNVTESNGSFDLTLPKVSSNMKVAVAALAQDDTASNNVVVHGPYNMVATYSKYAEEVLESSLSDMILDMEPYAYYPMTETTGTTLADASGNGRNATAVGGITLDQDAMEPGSRAIDFNGVDGYLDLPDGYDDMTKGFTFEAWVKFDSFDNYSRVFEFASANEGPNAIILSHIGTTNEAYLVAKNGVGTTIADIFAPGLLNTSAWQHLVVRVTPDGTYSMWANGQKVTEELETLPPSVMRTINYIGKSTYQNNPNFNGRMSQIATYMHPLSDEEIGKRAYRGFGRTFKTMKSTIEQDNPDVYFQFDRLKTYEDSTGEILLTKNGSFDVVRNALVFNKDTTANNWLTTSAYKIPNGDSWTLTFSIKTATTHNDAIVISEWDQSADTGTYKVQLDASNKVKVFIGNGTTNIESTTLVNDDVWHHVVVRYMDGVVTLWVDGENQASLSTTVNYALHNLAIGNSSDGAVTHHFEGPTSLDDVAIYSHALSDVRIDTHYNQFVKKKAHQ